MNSQSVAPMLTSIRRRLPWLVLTIAALYGQDLPPPTFEIPFDGSVEPTIAAGATRHPSLTRQQATFIDGHQRKAILLGEGPTLVYQAEGNIPDEATLSFWLKPIDWQPRRQWRKLVTICPGGRAGMMFAHYPGRKPVIQFRWGASYGGAGHEATSEPLVMNEWNHVAIAWDTQRTRISFNGKLVLSRPHDNKYQPHLGERATLQFGGIRLGTSSGSSYGSDPWGQADTALDEFTVYPGMLSTKQVAQLAGKESQVHPLQGPPREPQILTIPKVSRTPSLDGRIDDDEWTHAASLPVLIDARDPGRSFDYPPQDIYLAYTDEALLLAMRVHFPLGVSIPKGASRKNLQEADSRVFGDESFEWWLYRPDTDQRFRFAGNPAGGFSEILGKDESWAGNWTYRTTMTMTVYGNEQWDVEVAVPFETLGIKAADQTQLTMNLCRTWRCLDALGLTAWNGYGQYPETSHFGIIQCVPQAPGFAFQTTGSPSTGRLQHRLRVSSAAEHPFRGEISMILEAPQAENDRIVQTAPLQLKPDDEAILELTCSIDDPLYQRIRYEFRQDDSNEPLMRYSVPFSLRTEFLDIVPLNLQHAVVVKPSYSLYTKRLQRANVAVEAIHIRVEDPTGRTVETSTISDDNEQRIALPEDGPWGEYRVTMVAEDENGREHDPNEQRFMRPETPIWAKQASEAAITTVLPPFTPLETTTDGDSATAISCWGRTYRFTSTPFPASIRTGGNDDILAAPVSLQVDGTALTAPIAVTRQSDVRAEFKASARVREADIHIGAWAEYDGLIWYDIAITAKENIEALELRIPLKASEAQFAHCTASMMSLGGGRTFPVASADSLKFWPVVWVGNFERGLCWFTEGRHNLVVDNPQPIAFEHHDDHTALTAMLASALSAGETYEVSFGLLATPVKPLHPRYPLNNFGYHSALYDQPPDTPLYSTVWWTFHKWFLDLPDYNKTEKLWGTPAEWYPRSPRPGGTKWIPYLDPCTLSSEYPEARHYLREWEILPAQHRHGFKRKLPDGAEREFSELWMSPASESFRKYFAWRVADLIERTGTQGLYFDFGCAMRDANRYHGARGGYYILAMRDFYRRIAYEFVRAGIDDYMILVHNSKSVQIPALTFTTHFFNGEHHRVKSGPTLHDGKDYLDTLPLYYFGIEHSGLPWGIHGNMLPEFPEAKHLIQAIGVTEETVPEYLWKRTSSVVMPTLLHGCLPGGLRVSQPYYRHVVNVLDQFDIPTATFHPYWSNQDQVQVDHPNVKVSIYSRPESPRLLIVAGNLGEAPAEVTLQLDASRFYDGWESSPLRGMKTVVKRDAFMQVVERMGSRDARLLDVEPGQIRLWIRRHGLALIEANGYEKVR